MHSEVTVSFGADQVFQVDLRTLAPMAHDEARRWLDEQFTALDCEPLRPSGKVLLADKVLVVARAAGARRFADAAWRSDYARAAQAVLARPVVRVDVPQMAVTY